MNNYDRPPLLTRQAAKQIAIDGGCKRCVEALATILQGSITSRSTETPEAVVERWSRIKPEWFKAPEKN